MRTMRAAALVTARLDTSNRQGPSPRRKMAAALSWVVGRILWRLRKLEFFSHMLRQELTSKVKVRPAARLAMWRRGFLGESYVFYDLRRNNPRQYVSDVRRYLRTPFINGEFAPVLDNKLIFHETLDRFPGLTPDVFGLISDGRVHSDLHPDHHGDPVAFILELLQSRSNLVIKPVTGGGGGGIDFLLRERGRLMMNGRVSDRPAIGAAPAGPKRKPICEFVRQHDTIAALYPGTSNTLRILTALDRDGPFVAAAILRIGCRRSEPFDNWLRGGLSAPVDLSTGVLGRACSLADEHDRVEWHERHPDTGSMIADVELPHWRTIKETILALVARLGFLRYVGWDALITAEGFKLLEGNNYAGLASIQVHGPLLANPRLRAFYVTHGVIRS